jgi:hypothetical protein
MLPKHSNLYAIVYGKCSKNIRFPVLPREFKKIVFQSLCCVDKRETPAFQRESVYKKQGPYRTTSVKLAAFIVKF